MKTGIHPTYNKITVTCACGNTFETGSTLEGDMRVEICANCHPLYTGKSKLIDAAGRVDKFEARRKQAADHLAAKQARTSDKAQRAAAAPVVEADHAVAA